MPNAPSPESEPSQITVLAGGWQPAFENLVASANERISICAPYITEQGVNVVQSVRAKRDSHTLTALLLTDLSPLAICAGATEPSAVYALRHVFPRSRTVHLPRLHAKVYAADRKRAIVTSGNLTHGGLVCNRECGLLVEDPVKAALIDDEVSAYAGLGADVTETTLDAMCGLAIDARAAYRAQIASASRDSTRRLRAVLKTASDTMMRARLAEGPINSVFARTIEFLLRRHGPLSTVALHPMIQEMHPDLCDDSVDRVIDGKHYGKKWKHYVRNAQQQLKKQGTIERINGSWALVS